MRIEALSSLGGVQAPAVVGSPVSEARPSQRAPSPAASTAISRVGELMNRLQQAALKDPARFKALATQTSGELRSAAAQTAEGAAPLLNDLSARFAEVARTGEAAALTRAPSGAQSSAASAALSAEIDAAFNLKPPPLGPWFPK